MRSSLVSTLPILLLSVGCTDGSSFGARQPHCDDDAPATLLASKLDDDDGDGNPIDENYPLIDDEDDDIADHTWVRDRSGLYHLFFHSESLRFPNGIEHYTTWDFQELEYVGVALTVEPTAWDSDAVWAPHVIEHDGTYYMFYTGVAGVGPDAVQRIGLATSKDLTNWMRAPINRCAGTSGDGCVYECDESWTTWGDAGGNYDHQCRDGFILWDDEQERWLMFATARSTTGFGVVTVASASNFTDWDGLGFIDATTVVANGSDGQPTGGQAENPLVVTSEGMHYLLFTDWQDPEDSLSVATPRSAVQYATSNTLSIDDTGSANWVYRGYTPDPGVNATEVIELRRSGVRWLMSQSVWNANSGVPKAQRRQLRLKCATFARGVIATSNWGSPISGWFPAEPQWLLHPE